MCTYIRSVSWVSLSLSFLSSCICCVRTRKYKKRNVCVSYMCFTSVEFNKTCQYDAYIKVAATSSSFCKLHYSHVSWFWNRSKWITKTNTKNSKLNYRSTQSAMFFKCIFNINYTFYNWFIKIIFLFIKYLFHINVKINLFKIK